MGKQTILLGGNFSKKGMGGPVANAEVTVTTKKLNRILKYEPRDLTISVEAGTSYAELSRVLAENHQMIPLDPPGDETATIGGIVGANLSGPRRRLYGTARDFVIGMQFATLEGKLVQSGGMVVKNVAGLDMGKLMIGSFGTLAAMAVVNFKLFPQPAQEETVLLEFETLPSAMETRDRIIRNVLQPEAVDLLNPAAASPLGYRNYVLAVRFGGNNAVVQRYRLELSALGQATSLSGPAEARLWQGIQNYTPQFLQRNPTGAVVRVSSNLTQLEQVFASLDVPTLARAATGVTYAYFSQAAAAAKWITGIKKYPWRVVMEFAPEAEKHNLELWPSPGSDFEMMKKIKALFDPDSLLNYGRLYRLL